MKNNFKHCKIIINNKKSDLIEYYDDKENINKDNKEIEVKLLNIKRLKMQVICFQNVLH